MHVTRMLCAASLTSMAFAGAHAAAQDMRPPVASACVTSPYGPRRQVGPHAPAAFHNGIDLRAPAGGAVYAVADGQVAGIRRRGAGGLEVAIRHNGPRGLTMTLYAHLGSVAPALAEGRWRVTAGEKIGVVGRSGVTYGTHLYFEAEVDGRRVDPAPLLGVQGCG
ncbi:murein hydrolase activator EnvC family protein [Limobrevibacterium gyesilva]|uniref:M23 family metallopeptidase n=1 Tax=Limobrevibacterium gyesilva TaxID=2991712 RepID=A0AA41YJ38_9PROT|nr:M23 family metallopeptidase [Limobrevibacterium gyesilva]MCW3474599.1 M23 family metallopeptidase [Limobrevibacterium gyesilva]